MATVYTLKGIGAALSYNASGLPVVKGELDVPECILNPALLALAASPKAKLTSFAGFANGDSVKIAKIPKGFLAQHAIVQHKKGEATVTINIGDADSGTLYSSGIAVASATDSILCAQSGGAKIYNAEGYLLITFGAASAELCAFSVSLFGMLAE